MSALDFARLREGGPGCPSDLLLDRLVVGELDPTETRSARAHAKVCAVCANRIARREMRFGAYPEIDAAASLARLEARLAPPPGPVARARSWLRRRARTWWAASTGLALAAAALLVLVPRPHATSPPSTDEGGARMKGGLRLRVHRMKAGGGSDEIDSGTVVRTGDRLRFVVDLPVAGRIRVLDVAAAGALAQVWPTDATVDERRPAGPSQVLPGALEVDEDPRPETLWLVECPTDGAAPTCRSRGVAETPACPRDCTLASFVLDKAH